MWNLNSSNFFFYDNFSYKTDYFVRSVFMRKAVLLKISEHIQIALRYFCLHFSIYRSSASRVILSVSFFLREVLKGTHFIWMLRYPAHCFIKLHGVSNNKNVTFSQQSFDAKSDVYLTRRLQRFLSSVLNYYSAPAIYSIEVHYFLYRNHS